MENKIEIKKIFLMDFKNNKEVYKLNIKDKDLQQFSYTIVKESEKRLLKYNSEDKENVFKMPSRLDIEKIQDEETPYSVLIEILEKCYNSDFISTMDSIGNSFFPDIIIYEIEEVAAKGTKEKYYYIAELKKDWFVEDLAFFIWKKKTGSDDSVDAKLTELKKAIILPCKDFLCKIEEKGVNKNNIKIFKVKRALELFGLNKEIIKLAKNKIDFKNKMLRFKLTQNSIGVKIENADKIQKILEDNIELSSALSRFSGRKNLVINSIESNQLERVIGRLNSYTKTSNNLEEKQIPKYVDNTLVVDENSFEMFISLLRNKVIERLLDGKIDIPGYK
ncbi:hypothetical protein ACVRWQ_03225 [Streptococcus phocae subsp. salmonis]